MRSIRCRHCGKYFHWRFVTWTGLCYGCAERFRRRRDGLVWV